MKPEKRDVEFAQRIAMASLADWRRCNREYGPKHKVTQLARECYMADETYWRETLKAFVAENE